MTTPHIIKAQIGFNKNRQILINNIASAEKSPISQSHKSYNKPLPTISEKN